MSIPSFRKTNLVFPFSSRNDSDTHITKTLNIVDDKYILSLPKMNGIKMDFVLFFGKDRSNNKTIVDRILGGKYKMSDSQIQFKDGELFLLLTVDIPVVKNEDKNLDCVMGIDLGINRPVSIYITKQKHQPNQITIGEKIQHDRMRFYRHRSKLQKNLKYASGGHGVKNKLMELDRLKEKEKNWAQLTNHNISREVIRIAKEYNVGIIKMEDLTGISTEKNDYFLKSWAYYQLQTFIEYKAKQEDIEIQWVNPAYTSQTCSICGHCSPENRSDKDKTIFKCTNPECSDFEKVKDADINAAQNISMVNGTLVKGKSKKGKIEKAKLKKEEHENI
jgi:IS605 OrfB family transposase